MKQDQQIVYTNNEIKIKNTFVMLTKSKIGSGSFGEIYNGYNINTNEKLAFKLELSSSKSRQLAQEYKILKSLQGYSKKYILIKNNIFFSWFYKCISFFFFRRRQSNDNGTSK